MSVARTLACQVIDAKYDELPPEAVHQVKRVFLDSLACMFGARTSDAARIVEETIEDIGGPGEATIVGSDRRSSALNAILVNGTLLRFLDYNDILSSTIVPGPRHGHNSEIVPAILALTEREGLGGRDAIVATSIGYDVATRFTESIRGKTLEERGWNMDLRAAVVVPLIASRLLGLDAERGESALGICLSRGLILNILDSSSEPNTMAKNLRFGMTAHLGVMATYLARRGFTGPARVFEGEGGFIATVLNGEFDLEHMLSTTPAHRVMEAGFKQFTSCFATHGHLTATLGLVHEHDLRPEQVERVRIRTTTRGARHTGDPARRFPTDKETADHSSHYLTAIAVVDRAVGLAQFTPAKYGHPEVRRLVDRVTIEGDSELDAHYPSAIVEIDTTGGRTLQKYVRHPRGHRSNPMTDAEIEAKFTDAAAPHAGAERIRKIVDAVWNLERLERISDLTRLLTASG